MLKIDLLQDEDLRGCVCKFISGLLPHDKFDSSVFSQNLNQLFAYIHRDEFQMEFRLLLNALSDLGKLKATIPSYEPSLTRETFESLVTVNVYEAVINPEVGMKEWMDYEGMPSNMSLAKVREEASQKLYNRAIDLYDECFALEQDSREVLNLVPELKAAFMSNVSEQSIIAQTDIIRHGLRIGRRNLYGYDDWFNYTLKSFSEIRERLREAEDSRTVMVNSVEASKALLSELHGLSVPIAKYDIPEIDRYTPILRHRLVVVVGKENIGKTKFAIDKSVNVLLAGYKVVYMCGESQKAKVYADILTNYIFKKYGIFVRSEHIANPDDCPEEIAKIIGMSIDDIVSQGRLILSDEFHYDTLYEEMQGLYDTCKFDMMVIDHSCALAGTTGDGSLQAKITKLAQDCKDFRKANPVCIMVTSHPSTTAKETDNKGKATMDSPTKGSQNLSADADEVFVLRDNETLRKQGLVSLENTKRRDAGKVLELIILRKRFEACAFIYEPELQTADKLTELKSAEALQALENINSTIGYDLD